MATNLDRLQAAGIANRTPLGEPYSSVINELSERELKALISVKRRFDERTDVQAHGAEMEEPAQEFFALL